MSASNDDVLERLGSEDYDENVGALAELVDRGRAGTPVLIEGLRSPNVRARQRAAEGLATTADPAAADALFAALNDADDQVRAQAAAGLAAMRDPRALDALIRTLNDFPDAAHAQFTLSSYALMAYGPAALPRVAPLLKSPDPLMRAKAIWIIKENVSRMLGAGEDWNGLWERLGRYDAEQPEAERDRAADQWSAWIAEHVANGQARHD
jgi:HEAT repeat protein